MQQAPGRWGEPLHHAVDEPPTRTCVQRTEGRCVVDGQYRVAVRADSLRRIALNFGADHRNQPVIIPSSRSPVGHELPPRRATAGCGTRSTETPTMLNEDPFSGDRDRCSAPLGIHVVPQRGHRALGRGSTTTTTRSDSQTGHSAMALPPEHEIRRSEGAWPDRHQPSALREPQTSLVCTDSVATELTEVTAPASPPRAPRSPPSKTSAWEVVAAEAPRVSHPSCPVGVTGQRALPAPSWSKSPRRSRRSPWPARRS